MTTVKIPCYCGTLRQATRALTSFYDDQLRLAGIRVTQFTILRAVEVKSGARIRDLEDILAIDQTTLTRNLAILNRRKLVAIVERPSGREKCWGLTPQGEAVLAAAKPLWEAAQSEVRSRMGALRVREFHSDAFRLAAAFS